MPDGRPTCGAWRLLVCRLPYSAINFWAYERLTESWNAALPPVQGSHGMDVARRLTAGGVAGMAACAVVCLKPKRVYGDYSIS